MFVNFYFLQNKMDYTYQVNYAWEMGTGQLVLSIAVWILVLVSWWKVFEKAGEKWWKCLIPIYNLYILLKIAGKPGRWLLLFIVPIVNIVIIFMTYIALAKKFGKSGGFGVGLALLWAIFFPILAFWKAKYNHHHKKEAIEG